MRMQLENAFNDCKFLQNCICIAKSPFELTSKKIFFLCDEGGTSNNPVRIVNEHNDFQLTVNNPSQKEICLTKLDKCLIPNDIPKCECLLFDTNRLFLVEIKSSSTGTRSNKRKKAREQLSSTIQLLLQKGIDISNYKVKAIICFKNMEPRITNSAANTAKADFLQRFQIELEERNYIDF